MSSLVVYVLDTETIGKDAGPNRLVEFGVTPLLVPDVNAAGPSEIIPLEIYESYVKPGEPISFGAMATHNITEDMVADAPDLVSVIKDSPLFRDERIPKVVSAHNAEFDKGFVGSYLDEICAERGSKGPYWLDTWRAAKHVFTEVEGYSNQSLRYELGLQHELLAPGGAHRAGSDALVTALLLQKMLEIKSLRELCEIQHTPVLIKKMMFGKYRGMAFEELEQGYLNWILRSELDQDVKFSATTELARRAAEARRPRTTEDMPND